MAARRWRAFTSLRDVSGPLKPRNLARLQRWRCAPQVGHSTVTDLARLRGLWWPPGAGVPSQRCAM